jgi:hypothetical protein
MSLRHQFVGVSEARMTRRPNALRDALRSAWRYGNLGRASTSTLFSMPGVRRCSTLAEGTAMDAYQTPMSLGCN